MSRKFEIGDKARVNCVKSSSHNCECTVISGLVPADDWGQSYMGYTVDIFDRYHIGTLCVFEPHELIPLYDGNLLVSWSECLWQPRLVKA